MKKCLGCGITLQNKSEKELGYTEKLENNLCERCFKLKNYGIYQKVSLTNKDYKSIIKEIPSNSNILYITDILSLECPSIEKFNNITLVITKKDILPKSIKKEKIINYLQKKYPKIKDIYFISSKTTEGVEELYNKIKKYQKVYLIGSTNSGKSTLINRLISLYGNKENYTTVSMYPSTTLNKIEINIDKLKIIDTPGLINKEKIKNYLKENDIKKLNPKKEIKPKTCQINNTGSIIIDNYVRIDYETKEKNSLVIYTSNSLKIRFASKNSNLMHDYPSHIYNLSSKKDLVIEGLGFIKVKKEIKLTIYTIKDINMKVRDNLI